MKNILFTIFSFLFLAVNGLYAQVDNLEDKTRKGQNQSLEKELIHKREYLDLNFRQEKTLVKLSISYLYAKYNGDTLHILNYAAVGGNLAFEQKICPSLSFIYENPFSIGFGKKPIYYIEGDAGFRYYYQIKKRIAQATGANNFHSNYFSISLDQIYAYYTYYMESYSQPIVSGTDWRFKPSLSISWGIQRRIGKLGFFDVAPYLRYNFTYSNYYCGAKLQFGLAWGK